MLTDEFNHDCFAWSADIPERLVAVLVECSGPFPRYRQSWGAESFGFLICAGVECCTADVVQRDFEFAREGPEFVQSLWLNNKRCVGQSDDVHAGSFVVSSSVCDSRARSRSRSPRDCEVCLETPPDRMSKAMDRISGT